MVYKLPSLETGIGVFDIYLHERFVIIHDDGVTDKSYWYRNLLEQLVSDDSKNPVLSRIKGYKQHNIREVTITLLRGFRDAVVVIDNADTLLGSLDILQFMCEDSNNQYVLLADASIEAVVACYSCGVLCKGSDGVFRVNYTQSWAQMPQDTLYEFGTHGLIRQTPVAWAVLHVTERLALLYGGTQDEWLSRFMQSDTYRLLLNTPNRLFLEGSAYLCDMYAQQDVWLEIDSWARGEEYAGKNTV